MSIQELTTLLNSGLYSANSTNTVSNTTSSSNGSDENSQSTVTQSDFQDSYESILSQLLARKDAIPSGTYANDMSEVNLYGGKTLVYQPLDGTTTADTDGTTATATTAAGTTATGTTATGSTTASEGTDASQKTSESGSSDDSSDDSDSTTTELVQGQDGSIYLRTTTTSSDGTETVTMTKIADGMPMDRPPLPPEAAVKGVESDASTDSAESAAATASSSATDSTTEASDATEATQETSESTSSDSSDDSDSTTTELVQGQDGGVYLKTTTTASDGTETVTMTKIADGMKMDRPPLPPEAFAQNINGMQDQTGNQMTANTGMNQMSMDAMGIMGMNSNALSEYMLRQSAADTVEEQAQSAADTISDQTEELQTA